ncbi:MAG: SH3 domain-containing protein [Syntrophobacter sp.]
MSDKDLARRTDAQVCFDGVDISASLRQYLISLTYTDNEEDETDDLQIKIEDRDGVWQTKWLNAAMQAAASGPPSPGSTESTEKNYKVTAKSGLNVRSGPGTNHSKFGALAYGTQIAVAFISNGWATIAYSGKTAYVCADYITEVSSESASGAAAASDSTTVKGLSIQAVIVRKNWNSDGKDKVLDCGQFELDSMDADGPPATITIKGTSLPFKSHIRQTKKSKAWEAYTLSGIASEMASMNGMTCMYESATDPHYARIEQITMSDIAFLSKLCHDAGISLKATNKIIVLFDQATYEAKTEVFTIQNGSGIYTKYKLRTGAADKEYASCRVRYIDPITGATIQATAYAADYKADNKNNQCLEITAKVGSIGEAKAMAGKMLRLKNKYQYTASFTLPGNPDLVAGVTVVLTGWGPWDGKYIVNQATHSTGSSGYTTQIKLRHVLEGY